ncbi:MAG: hypothetical protein ACRD1R_03205 [Acidobacteriota bacterium]
MSAHGKSTGTAQGHAARRRHRPGPGAGLTRVDRPTNDNQLASGFQRQEASGAAGTTVRRSLR